MYSKNPKKQTSLSPPHSHHHTLTTHTPHAHKTIVPPPPHLPNQKPRRITNADYGESSSSSLDDYTLQPSTYLRIHHNPRRFPPLSKPLTVVSTNPYYTVIDKPPLLPCHATVDNNIENVLSYFPKSLLPPGGGAEPMLPSRLDTCTSGLLIVSHGHNFLRYYNSLLRAKTEESAKALPVSEPTGVGISRPPMANRRGENIGVKKIYRCISLIRPSEGSEFTALPTGNYTHYLVPTIG